MLQHDSFGNRPVLAKVRAFLVANTGKTRTRGRAQEIYVLGENAKKKKKDRSITLPQGIQSVRRCKPLQRTWKTKQYRSFTRTTSTLSTSTSGLDFTVYPVLVAGACISLSHPTGAGNRSCHLLFTRNLVLTKSGADDSRCENT